jgi:hypothetical protein
MRSLTFNMLIKKSKFKVFIFCEALFAEITVTVTVPHVKGYDYVSTKKTREGWPLPTFETETNGDSRSTHGRGPFLVGSLGSSCWYKRFLSCFGCSCQPSTKYCTSHYFYSFVPITQQAGQAVVQGRLYLNVCL